jgi:hypothetical protein
MLVTVTPVIGSCVFHQLGVFIAQLDGLLVYFV